MSIILAILSLVFAILFYRWSEKSNKQTFELSKGIENNTKKIEDLFDRFYSDTFGLMKSNYEAMQSSFFNQPISTGDSSFTEEEQVENIITSMLVKTKISTRENICHFIDKVYPKKGLKHSDINKAIDLLHTKEIVYINENLISIATTKESSSDEG
ncbi:MAG: hypothetical protein CMB99_05795 [Flavobacteriaceae bacterium]|nr:hypothetical protein [Flavobacteriaceae bacterium]